MKKINWEAVRAKALKLFIDQVRLHPSGDCLQRNRLQTACHSPAAVRSNPLALAWLQFLLISYIVAVIIALAWPVPGKAVVSLEVRSSRRSSTTGGAARPAGLLPGSDGRRCTKPRVDAPRLLTPASHPAVFGEWAQLPDHQDD